MFKREILGVLKSKRAWIFILLIIIIPMIDLGMVCRQDKVWYKRAHREELQKVDEETIEILKERGEDKDGYTVRSWISPPALSSYLSGSSDSHVPQLLLLWLMPLFVLNLVSDRYISEYHRGYINAIYTRASRKKFLINKLLVSFIVSFCTFAIGILANFAAAQVIYRGGDNFFGLEVQGEKGGWFKFMFDCPNRAYLTYALITCIIAGLCGVICTSIALISKKYTITYLVSFFLWLGLIMMKDTIVNLMQPFTEYGMEYMVRAGGILLGVVLVVVVTTFIYKIKRDDI